MDLVDLNIYVPESEKGEHYYKNWVYNILSWWSSLQYNPFTQGQNNQSNGIDDTSAFATREYMLKLYSYLFGKQQNIDFNFMTKTEQGVNKPAVFIAGKHIRTLIDFLKETYLSTIKNAEITAYALTEDNLCTLDELRRNMELYLKFKDMITEMEETTGVKLSPIDGYEINSLSDIKDALEDLSLKLQESAILMARETFYECTLDVLMLRVLIDVIVVGFGMVRIQVINGKTVVKRCQPYYSIGDFSIEDDYNSGANYAGHVQYMTLQEIIEEYHPDDETIEKIRTCGSRSNFGITAPLTVSSFFGAFYQFKDGLPRYLVYRTEWQDAQQLNYVESVSKNGTKYFNKKDTFNLQKNRQQKRLDNKTEYSKYVPTTRYAVVVADILIRGGLCENQIPDVDNPGKQLLSYRLFTPDILFGQNTSILKALIDCQNNIDLYEFKKQEIVERDKGKVAMFDVVQFPEKYNLNRTVSEIQTRGLTVKDSSKVEDDALRNLSAVEIIDLSLDVKAIQAYDGLIAVELQKMEDICHVPKILQGLIQSTDSGKVQSMNVSQASMGSKPLFTRFNTYIEKVLQQTVNVKKVMLLHKGNEYVSKTVLSPTNVRMFKLSPKTIFEWWKIYIQIDEPFTQSNLLEIKQIAQAQAQNGTFDMMDYVAMSKAKTMQEFELYLIKRNKERKKEEAILQKQQFEQQALLQKQQAQNQAVLQQQQLDAQMQMHEDKLSAQDKVNLIESKMVTDRERARLELETQKTNADLVNDSKDRELKEKELQNKSVEK